MSELVLYGKGPPGITRENEFTWVARDEKGRVIGGARAHADFSPPLLDVEVVPEQRRKGWATRLYAEIAAVGIDVEAGSDRSLADGLLTPLGYAFQVGRRAKKAGHASHPVADSTP